MLSSMSSFNSSSLFSKLSESKLEAKQTSFCSVSLLSSLSDWFKYDCWKTVVSTSGVTFDIRELAAVLALLQCRMWCLNDFCLVFQCLQLRHCLFDQVDMVWISYTLFDQLFINLIIMKLGWWGKLIVTINDEYFHLQYFIFGTIHGYILDKYWKISKRNIKLKIKLLIHLVYWYEMDSNKSSIGLICDHMMLLSNSYFFSIKTSSLDWRHKL